MVFSIQLAIFLFIEILRFNCEIYNLLSENIKRPFMGRCFCPSRYLDAVFWHLMYRYGRAEAEARLQLKYAVAATVRLKICL